MEYIYGSGLLFAAFLLIAVGRLILSRPGASLSIDDFGVAESISLVFTGLVAFGVTEIVTTLAHDPGLVGASKMLVALGALAGATALVWIALGRMFPRGAAAATDERPVDPSAPGGNRRGRPTASGAQRGGGAKIKRAA